MDESALLEDLLALFDDEVLGSDNAGNTLDDDDGPFGGLSADLDFFPFDFDSGDLEVSSLE